MKGIDVYFQNGFSGEMKTGIGFHVSFQGNRSQVVQDCVHQTVGMLKSSVCSPCGINGIQGTPYQKLTANPENDDLK